MHGLLLATLFGVVFSKYHEYHHTSITSDGTIIPTILEANQPTICDPTVQQYSGYLKAGGTNNSYFYWFFESRNNASKDPFIMWLTGGPGCSSQLALLVENGPCHCIADGHDTKINPYSWNSNANIMWVDQPPGTGFSIGTAATTELQISQDMWAFLQSFITTFPQYFNNGFYITGESYSGHYIPAIVNYIWTQNIAKSGTNIPLLGFAIGNGLTDPYIQYSYYAPMAYNSSTAMNSNYSGIPISYAEYNAMMQVLPNCLDEIHVCNVTQQDDYCDSALEACNGNEIEPVQRTGVNIYNLDLPCDPKPGCYDHSAENVWLNNKTVQEQLGVHMEWVECDGNVNANLESDWMKEYESLIIGPIEDNIRGLIYAGDLDFICNWLGNEAWTLALPWNGQKDFNNAVLKPWNVNGKAVGEIRQGSNTNFTFLRIYEAGHMVPMDQPQSALAMINAFITNTLKPN